MLAVHGNWLSRKYAALFPHLTSSQEIEFRPVTLKTRSKVKETPSWDWVIFQEDFTAPVKVERARQQTWSLKPELSPENTGRK